MYGIQYRTALGNGYTLVIHHLYFSFIILSKHKRRLAGTAQAAAHRNMYDLIIAFQKLIPQLQNIFRRWLGGGNGSTGFQPLIKFLLGQANPFKIGFPLYHKRHGKHADTQFLRLLLGDAAVTVRYNCNL